MAIIHDGQDVFEMRSEPIDVTSNNRPDPSWRFTDPAGHEHAWHADGSIATDYQPSQRYSVPTVRWVVEAEATDEYPEIGHCECLQCGALVQPRCTADMYRMFIPGVRYCLINGQHVSLDEFTRRWNAAHPDKAI